ncbi:MAG TPA: LysR family transcriptional regulator [Microvirga sp.]|nr:LysR family transcriptional regulator [Microvirga sp.]
MDALSLDQFEVFVTVVEAGSFSAAARRLNRAQSAVTYAVQKLEDQVGAELFDRSAYRPTLSEAGRTLLPQVRRILDDVGHFRASARQITRGLETELRVLVGAAIPVALLAPVLGEFREAFPTVQLRLSVLPFSLGVGRQMLGLSEGEADIRVLVDLMLPETLVRKPIAALGLVTVAAASHPLAQGREELDEHALRDHLQIVLSEPQEAVPGEDRRVVALNTWRVTDPAAQHALIRAGIGWGSLPEPTAAEDLASGRLVRISVERQGAFGQSQRFPIVAAHRQDEPLGPAGRWLFERLGEAQHRPANLKAQRALSRHAPGGNR